MGKKFCRPAIPLVVLIFILIFCWWIWANTPTHGVGSKKFVVKRGEGLASVSSRLVDEGIARSLVAIRVWGVVSGLGNKIQAGSYTFSSGMTPKAILELFSHGTTDVWVTFPEGWRREEIGRRLSVSLENFDYQKFISISVGKEGYLFPDTYLFPKTMTAEAIVKILEDNWQKNFNKTIKETITKEGLTEKQAMIFASLVERETGRDEDRPLVAGILIKRWKNGWPLQVDPTLQFALSNRSCVGKELTCDWWPEITAKEKTINSPYNTYKYKGLPPGPICNPGLASIKAVASPKNSEYWFYLSDRNGIMRYGKTAEEHTQNIRTYLN